MSSPKINLLITAQTDKKFSKEVAKNISGPEGLLKKLEPLKKLFQELNGLVTKFGNNVNSVLGGGSGGVGGANRPGANNGGFGARMQGGTFGPGGSMGPGALQNLMNARNGGMGPGGGNGGGGGGGRQQPSGIERFNSGAQRWGSAIYVGLTTTRSAIDSFDAYNMYPSQVRADLGIKKELQMGRRTRDRSSEFALMAIMQDQNRRQDYLQITNRDRRSTDATLATLQKLTTPVVGAALAVGGVGATFLSDGAGAAFGSLGVAAYGAKLMTGGGFGEGIRMLTDPAVREAYIQAEGLKKQKEMWENFKKENPDIIAGMNDFSQGAPATLDLQRRMFGGMSKNNKFMKAGGPNAQFQQFINNSGIWDMAPTYDRNDRMGILSALGQHTTSEKMLQDEASVIKSAVSLNLAGLSSKAAAQLVGVFANGSAKGAQALAAQLAGVAGDNGPKEQLANFMSTKAYDLNYGAIPGMGLMQALMAGNALNDPNKLQANIAAVGAFTNFNKLDPYQTTYGRSRDIEFAKKFANGNPNVAYGLDRLRQDPNLLQIITSGTAPGWFMDEGLGNNQKQANNILKQFAQTADPFGWKTLLGRRLPSHQSGNKVDTLARLIYESGGDISKIPDSYRSAFGTLLNEDTNGMTPRDVAISEWDMLKHPGGIPKANDIPSSVRRYRNTPFHDAAAQGAGDAYKQQKEYAQAEIEMITKALDIFTKGIPGLLDNTDRTATALEEMLADGSDANQGIFNTTKPIRPKAKGK